MTGTFSVGLVQLASGTEVDANPAAAQKGIRRARQEEQDDDEAGSGGLASVSGAGVRGGHFGVSLVGVHKGDAGQGDV